jgi:hypothetical protein
VGHEYRIEWKSGSVAGIKAWLERRGGLPVTFDAQERFEFRFGSVESASKLPDALVALEKDSVYFCDNVRTEKSAAIFRSLIDEALTHSGSSDSVVVHSL